LTPVFPFKFPRPRPTLGFKTLDTVPPLPSPPSPAPSIPPFFAAFSFFSTRCASAPGYSCPWRCFPRFPFFCCVSTICPSCVPCSHAVLSSLHFDPVPPARLFSAPTPCAATLLGRLHWMTRHENKSFFTALLCSPGSPFFRPHPSSVPFSPTSKLNVFFFFFP